MIAVCTRENLLQGLSAVERATSRRATLPILSHVAMEAKTGKMIFSATDLEIAIIITVPAKVEEGGKWTVPLRPFVSFIASLPEGTVQLKQSGKYLSMKSGSLHGKMHVGDIGEFPIIPKLSSGESIRIDGDSFLKALEEVLPAVAMSETRPELTGVSVSTEGNEMTIAATDTFRLAVRVLPYAHHEIFSVIIPQRSVQEMIRLFRKSGEVMLQVGENEIAMSTTNLLFTSRLLEGSFPDFRAIIPKSAEVTVRVPRDDFLRKLEASSSFTGRLNDVRLTMRAQDSSIAIEAENPDVGSFGTEVVGNGGEGGEESASFNLRYLIEGIRGIDASELIVAFSGEAKPLAIRPSDGNRGDLYLLMPIRSS